MEKPTFKTAAGRCVGVRKLALLVITLAVLPLVLAQTGIYYYWYHTRLADENASSVELAQAIAANFEGFVQDLAQHEQGIAEIFASGKFSDSELDVFLKQNLRDYPSVDSFSIVAPDGRIIAGSRPEAVGVSISDREYFQNALKSPAHVLSNLLDNKVTHKPAFFVARPVRGDHAQVLAVVVASVDPDRMGESILQQEPFRNRRVSIYDGRGWLAYRYPEAPQTWQHRQQSAQEDLVKAALAGQVAVGQIRPSDEEQIRLAARVPIGRLGWVAGSSIPQSVLLGPMRRTVLLVGLGNLAVLSLSVAASLAFSSWITGGIRRLRDRTLSDHPEHASPANASHIAEIRDLETAFSDMSLRRQQAEEELRAAGAELQRSNKDLEQFAYVASHDLQEPLRMISQHLQLVARRLAGKLEPAVRESMDFAVDGAVRMQALIRDLLEFSRAGRPKAGFVDTDMQSVVDLAMRNLAASIREAGAQVQYDGLPTVRAERGQMVQLLQNLLGNAVKYRQAGAVPRIELGARHEDRHWLFWVKDNGIGIRQEDIARLFAPFRRLHTRTEYPGTGIGLAICKRIVEYHCGRIWIESVPSQGSTFFFTIPDRP